MTRRLLNLLTALSLLVSVASAVLWVGGYATPRTLRLSWARADDRSLNLYRASSVSGQLCLIHAHLPLDDEASFRKFAQAWQVPARGELRVEPWQPRPWPTNRWGFGGYLYQRLGVRGDGSRSKWALPWWLVTFTASLLPASRGVAIFLRRRARGPGFCPVCRYDSALLPTAAPSSVQSAR